MFFSAGVKRLQHEADHSPVSSAEGTNEWSCTSSNHTRFHVGHKDNYISPSIHNAVLVVIRDSKILYR